MVLCNWTCCDKCRIYSKECDLISNRMHFSRNGHFEMKYNRKDLLVDVAIVAVVLGAMAIIVGSFPATLSKLLLCLKYVLVNLKVCSKEGGEILDHPL